MNCKQNFRSVTCIQVKRISQIMFIMANFTVAFFSIVNNLYISFIGMNKMFDYNTNSNAIIIDNIMKEIELSSFNFTNLILPMSNNRIRCCNLIK